ncbi:hypothetical protein [Clostridium botulinum]|uniref:hypothetical protein n=1 Tax=Clostridium botulinum TaxID=1491 RepID=UPI0004D4E33B|nr:hypothetical protein [Clostridium botulinum]KEH96176.1 hypothetical protein Z953_p0243 [Clostridium botulinum D str. 16868]MCD3202803.1 hypothetical protein [Clostridium botulinum C/D]MCD3230825.1 hypothetical protein [Clostridium botulinum C/D]MCD3253904.1 hypothetical protein [Clostridium botulinum C/D]MCD3279414.1 hypothetical protein [Clostridium botulinum C/D]
MRAGIRQKLIDNILELKECYEPNVPDINTVKPYGIILQGSDDNSGETIGFKRTIEIWLYEGRTTFKKLDSLTEKVIKTLHLQTIEGENSNETFTCMFEGTIGQDIIDEEWNAIARGLRFSIIALYEEQGTTEDTWIEALSKYTEELLGIKVYRDCWKKDFQVPSVLWRTSSQSKERINTALIKENKTLVCHVVSKNKAYIEKVLDNIEEKLITDLKIPLNIKDKRYLTIESIQEDRDADMLGIGQLTVELSRRKMIQENNSTIDKIYSRGNIE